MNTHYQTEDEIAAVVQGFESCTTGKDDFPHHKHLAVAIWYLRDSTVEQAFERMRASLMRFLNHHGIGQGIYKEELTRAWINLVHEEWESLDADLPLVIVTNTVIGRLTDPNAVFDRYPDNVALHQERTVNEK